MRPRKRNALSLDTNAQLLIDVSDDFQHVGIPLQFVKQLQETRFPATTVIRQLRRVGDDCHSITDAAPCRGMVAPAPFELTVTRKAGLKFDYGLRQLGVFLHWSEDCFFDFS